MKYLMLVFTSVLLIGNLNAQIKLRNGLGDKGSVQIKPKTGLKIPKVQKAHVLNIDGSIYKDLCVPSNRPGGDCGSYETAWKNGYLYTCGGNDGPILVPRHEGDVFKCYSTGGIINIEITSNTTAQKRKIVKQLNH